MSGGAIVMLVLSIVIVWGGLMAGILFLRGHPDPPDDSDT